MKSSERLTEIEVRQSNQIILPSDSFWLLKRVKNLEAALRRLEIKIYWNIDDLVQKEFKEMENIIDNALKEKNDSFK